MVLGLASLGSATSIVAAGADADDDTSELRYTDEELEAMCHQDMTCGMWEECATIADKFKVRAGGAVLAAVVSKYYFRTKNHVQAVFAHPGTKAFGPWAKEMTTPFGVLLVRRAPENNRDDGVSKSAYQKGILQGGLVLDGRSPMVLWSVPPHQRWCDDPRARLCYGAATCWESWVSAKLKEPTNPQVVITEQTGLTNCIDLRPRTTREIRVWTCLEWNQHQSGTGFTVQQYVAKIFEYEEGFLSLMKANEWDWDSFGTGPSSRDSRTWEWLREKYESHGDLRVLDLLLEVDGIQRSLFRTRSAQTPISDTQRSLFRTALLCFGR